MIADSEPCAVRAQKGWEFEQCRRVRRLVFVEEQGVAEAVEQDGLDSNCSHWLVLEGGSVVATGRLRVTSAGYKLERIAVLLASRNRGLGAVLVRAMLSEVVAGRPFLVNAQQSAIGFWSKLGFEKVGPTFLKAGILHQRMEMVPTVAPLPFS